jgi:phenylacetate-CoA ligase
MAGKKPRVSVMSTYPSYLGQLVEEGLRRGYRPVDFGLERIVIGGELVSDGLKARSRHLFGSLQFDEAYAMTETWPVGGQRCVEGHLHFEPGQGLVEVVEPETGAPVLPGEAGSIVVTPFPPYRDTTLLLRYDTQDMARPVAGPLTCALRTMPATTNTLGKLRFSVQHDSGWTYPRDVLEALEKMEEVPLPARYGFWAVPGGVAVEVVTRQTGHATRRQVQRQLEERGVPVQEIRLLEHERALQHPIPLRCDLREVSFAPPPGPARVANPSSDPELLRAGC